MLKYAPFSLLVFALLFNGCSSENKKKEQHHSPSNIITLSPIEDTNSSIEVQKTQEGFILKNDPKKILVFDIFATWCAPCRAESKVLANIQKKFKKDVRVIGLSIEEDASNEKLMAYKKKYHADYTLTNPVNNQKLIDDIAANLKIGQRFPIPLIAIYKDGKLVNYYAGATEEEFIESDIKQALGK